MYKTQNSAEGAIYGELHKKDLSGAHSDDTNWKRVGSQWERASV